MTDILIIWFAIIFGLMLFLTILFFTDKPKKIKTITWGEIIMKTPTENIPEEIDADYQDLITCPYCGWVEKESWEYDIDEDRGEIVECGECEREFECVKSVTIRYCSYKKNG